MGRIGQAVARRAAGFGMEVSTPAATSGAAPARPAGPLGLRLAALPAHAPDGHLIGEPRAAADEARGLPDQHRPRRPGRPGRPGARAARGLDRRRRARRDRPRAAAARRPAARRPEPDRPPPPRLGHPRHPQRMADLAVDNLLAGLAPATRCRTSSRRAESVYAAARTARRPAPHRGRISATSRSCPAPPASASPDAHLSAHGAPLASPPCAWRWRHGHQLDQLWRRREGPIAELDRRSNIPAWARASTPPASWARSRSTACSPPSTSTARRSTSTGPGR